jgi:NAD(P)-dependent dehydrogenase (short-subunit alcohol dehydrogenase family)
MARVFITGSTDGLGRAAAKALIDEGHQVALHARSRERAVAVDDLASRSAGVVVGDLSSAVETRSVADQVNAIGPMDAVIHNAGISSTTGRSATQERHATIFAVNTLAPYLLTALIERPRRLVYLSSSMHRGGAGSLRDIDWIDRRWDSTRAYSASKLYVTALAYAIARRWPDVLCNAVDPGWSRRKWAARERQTISRWAISPRPGLRSAMSPLLSSAAATGIIVDRRFRPGKCLMPAFKMNSRPSSPK